MPGERMDWLESEEAALYALGALPEDEARAFKQHATRTQTAAAQAFAEVVAGLALSAPEVAPSANVRDKLLARIAQEPNTPADRHAANFSSRLGQGEWRELSPHTFCKTLFADAQTGQVTTLIKLEPGGSLPSHRHTGREQSLVLEGDCRVNGEVFYPGDFRVREAGTEDSAVTTERGTLILLIAPAQFELLAAR